MNLLQAAALFEQFCEDCSNRFDMSSPFIKDGYLWATNSRIAVRKQASKPDSIPKEGKKFPDCLSVFGQFKIDAEFISAPQASYVSVPCWACGETGTCNCEVCSGLDDGTDALCDCCGGSGTVHFPRQSKIGSATVDTRYEVLMRTLPDLMIAIPQPGEELKPISFKFDGGEGLLMPLDMSKA